MEKEDYDLVGRLIDELKLRKYSYKTEEKYRDVAIKFLKSKKEPKEFLLTTIKHITFNIAIFKFIFLPLTIS